MTIALATMMMKNDNNDVKTFLLNNLQQSINGSHFSQIQYMKKTLKMQSPFPNTNLILYSNM
jgi:hypothetical protein